MNKHYYFDVMSWLFKMFVEIIEDTMGILFNVLTTVCDGVLTVVVGVVCVCILVDSTQFKSGIFVGSKSNLDFLPYFV